MRRALLLLLALAGPSAALEVPFLSGRVNDHAGLLSPASEAKLDAEIREFEKKTGHQFAVLTLPSLDGEALEDFSLKVARTWGLGAKGKNDGLLLLVSRDDRKLRIEVGYGLEGAVPDAATGRIIRDVIVPRFRERDFDGGVVAGARAVMDAAEGRAPPPAEPPSGFRVEKNDFAALGFLEKVLMSFFVFGILGVFELVGLFAPGAGWFLYFFLIPFWASFPMAIWGAKIGVYLLGAHLIGFPILKLLLPATSWGRKLASSTGGGAGWSSGGGGFSSGGGGGGFSGGGGSFGGGGSSGSW